MFVNNFSTIAKEELILSYYSLHFNNVEMINKITHVKLY
jgi:hypothetical protein